jgi:HTH-type transcriptional regulator/antitoxin HipB
MRHTRTRITTNYTVSRILLIYTLKRITATMRSTARNAAQIGAIVRRVRRLQRLSQTELGDRIGLRQATISKLEKGEPATQISTLLDTLTALNLELAIVSRKAVSKNDLQEIF